MKLSYNRFLILIFTILVLPSCDISEPANKVDCTGEQIPTQPTQIRITNNQSDIELGNGNPLKTTISIEGLNPFAQYDFYLNLRGDAQGNIGELMSDQRVTIQGPISASPQYSVSFPNPVEYPYRQIMRCPESSNGTQINSCALIQQQGFKNYSLSLNKGSIEIRNITVIGINPPECS